MPKRATGGTQTGLGVAGIAVDFSVVPNGGALVEGCLPDIAVDLSIVQVNFHSLTALQQSMATVRQALGAAPAGLCIEFVVVDNESGHPTEVLADQPDVRVVANPGNPGFAAACNLGLDLARGTWVLLLNPDTRVPEDALRTALTSAAREVPAGAAVFGCRQRSDTGALAESSYPPETWPGPWPLLLGLPGLARIAPLRWRRSKDPASRLARHNHTHDTAAVQGSFLLLPRLFLARLDRLDPDFFLYFEELDWCARIGRRGHRIVHLADVEIEHTGAGGPIAPERRQQYYASELLFIRKHRGRLAALVVLLLRQFTAWTPGWLAHLAGGTLWRNADEMRVALRGTLATRVRAAVGFGRRPHSRAMPLRTPLRHPPQPDKT